MQVALELIQEVAGDEAVLVAAAGNFGTSRPCWPAAFRSVLSVASLTADGRPSEWSNRGFWIDCSTIGEGILTPYVVGKESSEVDFEPDVFDPPDPWALWSGTSFAAPQITGAIARLGREAGLTPREAVRQLLSRGKLVPDYGRALRFLPGT
jgi:subtilisin family serine protease